MWCFNPAWHCCCAGASPVCSLVSCTPDLKQQTGFCGKGSVKKAADSNEKRGRCGSRSIRLVSCVLGDADLQLFCGSINREGLRETERMRAHSGSGAVTNTARGVNIQDRQWDLVATIVHIISGGNVPSDLHDAAS